MIFTPQETVLDYRMDSRGRIFARTTEKREHEIVCPQQKVQLIVERPEIALSLSNIG